MYQRHKDTLLLEEAYKATQLTQHLPNMTVQQVRLVIENASAAELEVIEELFGKVGAGLGNVAKGAKEALGRAGSTIKGAAKGAAGKVADVAAGGVAAAKGAAEQVGKNVKGMYQSGVDQKEAENRKSQLVNQLAQLEELFAAHIAASPESRLAKTKLDSITIGQLKRALGATATVKTRAATTARQGGFLGGAGAAAQKGYEKEQKSRAAAQAAPPAGATPAPA